MPKDYQHGESAAVPLGPAVLAQNPSGLVKALQVDASGNLLTAVTGAGSGGTSSVDKAAFTAGTSAGTPLMGAVNPADTPANGLLAIAALDSSRNLKVNVVAGGAGGGAVTVADGADVAEGATTDVAVTTDANGTLSAKLRGIIVVLLRMFALGTPVRVDPTGSTAQPVTGTFWQATQPVSAAALPLPTGASTAAKQPSLGTAGTASTDVITVQGIASMTKLLVTPDSVALPANQSVNVSQINGITPLMGAGNTGTGSPRVTIASDQVAIPVTGAGAAAAAVAGNPVRLGALGRTTTPTAVASAQLVDILADRLGRLFHVAPVCSTVGSNATPITAAAPTTTSIVAAPGAGNHLRIHRLWCQNFSAAASTITGYWCDGTTKKIPFQLAQGQPFSMSMEGRWELTSNTALNIVTTALTGSPSVEWYAEYETLAD